MAPSALTQGLLTEGHHSPLLLHGSGDALPKNLAEPEGKHEDFRTWLAEEVSEQFWIAGPLMVANLLQTLISIVSLMFVGHMGSLALSGSQIAGTMTGATGIHVLAGMANALETLCGQAYGAKEYRLSGIFLQRAIFVLTLCCIPISFIWWNTAPILKFIGQDPAISEAAQEYSRFLIPSLFAQAFSQPLMKFLQTQSAVKPLAVLSAVTLAIHVALCYLVILYLGVGFRGAAIVNGISLWIQVFFLGLYVNFSSTCKKTWTGFSTEAFDDIYLFLKIAVPSALMICLQFWCFNIITLISGLLPNPQLETSSYAVSQNILTIAFMIPWGLSAAVSTRVSNKLGAGLPFEAKAAMKVTVSAALIEGVTISLLFISLRNVFPLIFTSDPGVVNYVSSMAPFMAIVAILDSYQGILSGVARGCGWQRLGAYTSLIGYYGVGIPVSLLMTFYFNFHVYGLWIGIICGDFTQGYLLSYITLNLNWQKLADEATELVHTAKDHLHHDHVLP
ncbi:hypothetical protein R1flu_002821 [Riccia fluitans]|uniref:Protein DETOXIFICATION n=1 Tax=Riccia fluitans TaxID=41844 RepID=A0ABD1Y7A7_9MARC